MNLKKTDPRPCDKYPERNYTCGEGGKGIKGHNCWWCYKFLTDRVWREDAGRLERNKRKPDKVLRS